MPHSVTAVILAAGKGTRMKSAQFKVLHEIGHLPLIGHVLRSVAALDDARSVVVTAPDQASVRGLLPEAVGTAIQDPPLGTGHAVLAAEGALEEAGDSVLVLFGADPLIRPETLSALLAKRRAGAGLAVLGFQAPDPSGLGRIVTDTGGAVLRIVEDKDATPAERAIRLCNAGAMAIDGRRALDWLRRIGNANAKGEYYLTDIVAIARADGAAIAFVEADPAEVIGVDTRADLAVAEAEFQRRTRAAIMDGGVTLTAPETVFFAHDTEIGPDSVVEPHVVFGPGVAIAENVRVRAFSHIEGATLAAGVTVGPYARIRPESVIGEGARIGNFVEVKKATVGAGAKVNHLSYVGDATVGPAANVGAGTITCNYDGFAKHRTVIGEGAFIGSNTALVAPVVVGSGAIVAAGSTLTEDVPANALGIARGRQHTKENWAERFRAEQSARTPQNQPKKKE